MNTGTTALRVIVIVTATALFGMLLGGAFGWAAGGLAPSFFKHFVPWNDVEPVGFAVVIGASGGVLCGAALGGFAVLLQLICSWFSGARAK